MPNQMVLAWQVDVANTPLSPLQAVARLAAVELYESTRFDPVLGQLLGLTVVNDVSAAIGPSGAVRTLTLQMTASDTPAAPPPFPCHPRTSTPPELPYPLRRSVGLGGSFFVTNGLTTVPTAQTQERTLSPGDVIYFLSQEGVFYTIASIGPTSIDLTTPYTGVTGNSEAAREVSAPATIVAIYSTSELDTDGVATEPAIPAGPGARTVSITYMDSTGAGPFSVTTSLRGKCPAAVTLDGGSVDMASITNVVIAFNGGFGNSIGQITIVELSDGPPEIPTGIPIGTGNGAAEKISRTFKTITDETQLLISRHLAYLPPSYFALAHQGATTPPLAGNLFVTTGSKRVPTSENLILDLAVGFVIEFTEQRGTLYEIEDLSEKELVLTTVFSGIDTSYRGVEGDPTINSGTRGNLGKEVLNRRTDARLVDPYPGTTMTNARLAAPIAQFVSPQVAAPPPSPPGVPATFATPTFLSGLYTRQLQLALAGVAVTPQEITFA